MSDEIITASEKLLKKLDGMEKFGSRYKIYPYRELNRVATEMKDFATVHIQKYHKRLGRLLQDLTQVGDFLRDITAVPTTGGRSYFQPLTNTLAIECGHSTCVFPGGESTGYIRQSKTTRRVD